MANVILEGSGEGTNHRSATATKRQSTASTSSFLSQPLEMKGPQTTRLQATVSNAQRPSSVQPITLLHHLLPILPRPLTSTAHSPSVPSQLSAKQQLQPVPTSISPKMSVPSQGHVLTLTAALQDRTCHQSAARPDQVHQSSGTSQSQIVPHSPTISSQEECKAMLATLMDGRVPDMPNDHQEMTQHTHRSSGRAPKLPVEQQEMTNHTHPATGRAPQVHLPLGPQELPAHHVRIGSALIRQRIDPAWEQASRHIPQSAKVLKHEREQYVRAVREGKVGPRIPPRAQSTRRGLLPTTARAPDAQLSVGRQEHWAPPQSDRRYSMSSQSHSQQQIAYATAINHITTPLPSISLPQRRDQTTSYQLHPMGHESGHGYVTEQQKPATISSHQKNNCMVQQPTNAVATGKPQGQQFSSAGQH